MCFTFFCFNAISIINNLQRNNLNSGIKNGTEVTLKIPSNNVGDSNGDNNFAHKLLVTNT